MRQDSAHLLAIKALGWLASNDELFAIFLGSTGASAPDLATRAEDAEFHGSILDFLLMNDEWVIGFCDATGIAYSEPMAARMVLPGGEAPNWT